MGRPAYAYALRYAQTRLSARGNQGLLRADWRGEVQQRGGKRLSRRLREGFSQQKRRQGNGGFQPCQGRAHQFRQKDGICRGRKQSKRGNDNYAQGKLFKRAVHRRQRL